MLMYAMMMATLVVLVGVLAVDAVRDVLRWSARRAPRSAGPADSRSAASGTRRPRVVARES
jgi:hypothetical protein